MCSCTAFARVLPPIFALDAPVCTSPPGDHHNGHGQGSDMGSSGESEEEEEDEGAGPAIVEDDDTDGTDLDEAATTVVDFK